MRRKTRRETGESRMKRNPYTASARIMRALYLEPMTIDDLAKVLALSSAYIGCVIRRLVELRHICPVGVRNQGFRKGHPFLYGVRQ